MPSDSLKIKFSKFQQRGTHTSHVDERKFQQAAVIATVSCVVCRPGLRVLGGFGGSELLGLLLGLGRLIAQTIANCWGAQLGGKDCDLVTR